MSDIPYYAIFDHFSPFFWLLFRRQLFDPCATATVEVNEESYSHVAYLPPSAPCPTCVEAEMGVDRDSPYLSRGPHPLQATPNINKLATELLRLATTPEELWSVSVSHFPSPQFDPT